ncbi:translation initiation factor IF-3 [Paenibacillus camelliae]|uniref:translation initiation factor IF-3 n=1 Tax=Paenibacillus camelliae TaxID=512410 RepID=UPI00203C3501|nr:translation initiation factor IF-3 [Paenibacillus camelliae]MCM3635369.1 translation initiation factor IF-3 [Paenibacillus camelliae]
MALMMNEKIKAAEVELLDLDGQNLGYLATKKALQLAKEQQADLVCINIMSSPPQCQLIARGKAKQVVQPKSSAPKKEKEIRLTPTIEQHDYDTKLKQCEKLLQSGHPVALVIKLSGKQGPQAKALLEQVIIDLKAYGKAATGIQLSGKQAAVTILPS